LFVNDIASDFGAFSNTMKEINFITGNKNKLAEVEKIIGGTIKIRRTAIEGLPEIQGTPEEIARDKCRRAAEAVR
jgi:inosine triphosphate pyrophosphatase